MPRLCDIVKKGVPCKVWSRFHESLWNWNGGILRHDIDGHMYKVDDVALFGDCWEFEPTVESVLKERGYCDAGLGTFSCITGAKQNYPSVTVLKITSPDEARRICDFLDTLKGTK